MTIQQVKTRNGAPVKIWTTDVEEGALEQLLQASELPFIYKHIAVMPDVHWGMGSTVGSVIPTKKAIIPAAVGVDIGCGMVAAKLNLTAKDLPDNLLKVRTAIEAAIPHGRTDNGGVNDRGAWGAFPGHVGVQFNQLCGGLAKLVDKYPKLAKAEARAPYHLGTLGTGNHFIEVCLDKEDNVWVMLHSGSRGIGNKIGSYFIEQAKEQMERWHISTPNPDLAYLPAGTPMFDDYWNAVSWAQEFARVNREIMMVATISAIRETLGTTVAAQEVAINCHHNYVAIEQHFGENVFITRKGAVRARGGDLGIIPGSMGARSFIVRGKGNPDSFHSCSHGAGRKMSRSSAKKQFTVEDLALATTGIECRKDEGVIDEIPQAYKNIDEVMAFQSDLVDVVAELHQLICVKG